MRNKAMEALHKLGDARALIAALDHEDYEVALIARKALAEIGAAAVESLISTANNGRSLKVRRSAASILGQMGDARAVETFIDLLRKDGDWDVRRLAAEALGQLGDTRAVDPLVRALKDEDSRVRMSAARALDKLQWTPQTEDQLVYWIANQNWDRIATIGKPAVEPLLARLLDKDQKVQMAAAEMLGQLGDARAVEPLIDLLKVYNKPVWRSTANALGKIGQPAVEPLITQLKHPDQKIRQWSVEILSEIGDVRAVEPLNSALQDTDPHVSLEAAKALAKLKDARAFQPLWSRLATGEMFKTDAEPVLTILIELLDSPGLVISEDILAQVRQTNSLTVLIQTGEPAREVQDEDQYGRYTYMVGGFKTHKARIDCSALQQLAQQK